MAAPARVGQISFGEFLEVVHEDQKADLIDGVIFMASPENTDHNDLLGWLYTILRLFIQDRKLGKVTVDRVAYRLSDKTAPEPDIAVVLTERLDKIRRGYVEGPPDVAVEFVSPDSVDRDYESKRARYDEAGVKEYWIIDPDDRRATFLARGDSGFIEIRLQDHIFRSRTLPGFALDVRWLWQRPLPETFPIVRDLLSDKST